MPSETETPKRTSRQRLPILPLNLADYSVVRIDAITVGKRLRQLRPEKVDELAASIDAQGLATPILVQRDGDRYIIVVGRHRFAAVQKLGHIGIRAIVVDGLDADQAQLLEIDENLIRADLSPAERSLHLHERKRIFEKLHPDTKRGATGKGRAKVRQNGETNKRFTKDAAAKTSKSERTIQREVERAAKIADLADVVGTSLDAPDEMDALAKLPSDQQQHLIDRAQAGDRVKVKLAVKKFNRTRREQDLAAATKAASKALGEERYNVIYADPPWQFEVYGEETGGARLAANHYPTMETAAIQALKIPAADDCVLFLWVPLHMLRAGMAVIEAWGFKQQSGQVWDKDSDGPGYWFRNSAELLLVGTRGKVPAPALGEQPKQIIKAPRGKHSEKPAAFRELIGKMFPNLPKLEMFARGQPPEGWKFHGNEAVPTEDPQAAPNARAPRRPPHLVFVQKALEQKRSILN